MNREVLPNRKKESTTLNPSNEQMYNFYLNKRVPLPPGSGVRKLLLIMKLTTLILITVILHVSATSIAQKVTLKEKNMALTDVFDLIKSQTGYDFALTTDALKNATPVTINVKNEDLKDVLTEILQGRNLDFSLDNKIVVIRPKEESFLDKVKAVFVNTDIHGRVVGDDGQPLAGATVMVKDDYKTATMTDPNGYFILTNVPPNKTIIVSFIGYEKSELTAKGEIGTIKLKVTDSKLDEVQVIAYGRTSERLSVGDINAVSSKTIESQPVGNVLQALEGQMPGLFIKQATGLPGSQMSVQVMGQNSIGQGNSPLIVVDGIPYASNPFNAVNPVLSGGGLGGGASPLSFLNPSDIESVTLLKDADATSIYGSRAANGALLITTKKGKAGETHVTFNIQQGWGNDTRRVNLLNTAQYLQVRKQAFANDGLTVPSIITSPNDVNYDINGLWDQSRNTNWQQVLLGSTADYKDFNSTISGGTDNTQFLVGATYHREGTVFPSDFSDQKAALHFSLQNKSENKKFSLALAGNYVYDQNQLPSTDLTQTAILLAPNAPDLYNSDGGLNWAPNAAGNSSWTNPLAFTANTSLFKTNNFLTTLTLGYHLLSNLEIKTDASYNFLQSMETFLSPSSAQAPENRTTSSRYSNFQNNNLTTWNIQPQIVYGLKVNNGILQGIAGIQAMQTTNFGQNIQASGFSSDQLIGDIGSGTTLSASTTATTVYKYSGIFGRLNYSWRDKYILNLTARRDGSSRFGVANQFHNFWSTGGAWIFSEERAMKQNFPWLSFGKFAMSYGITGNDQIADYRFLSTFVSSSNATPYQGITGLRPTSLPNPYLQWEETQKFNARLDFGFFKDRILLSADYFKYRSSNELLSYALSTVTGFTSILENFPATVQNTGWELTLNTVNFKNKNFKWTSSFNVTVPRNKLVAFPNLAGTTYSATLVIGQPVNITKVYPFAGVDPATGVYRFINAAGAVTATPNFNTDRTKLENPNPQYYGGFQNTFSWKEWQVGFLIQFTKTYQVNNYWATMGFYPGEFDSGISPYGNQPISVQNNVWQHPGDSRSLQRYSTQNLQYNSAQLSSLAFTDGSYARLKNVNISYQLSDSWSKTIGLKNCRVYLNGQNLLTITKFSGLDPETAGSFTLPPLCVITVGLQANL